MEKKKFTSLNLDNYTAEADLSYLQQVLNPPNSTLKPLSAF